MMSDALDEARFELRFEGLRAADSTMDASQFGNALAAVDTIFTIAMHDLGAASPLPIRIVGRVRGGSVIGQLAAFASSAGPAAAEGVRAVSSILWVTRSARRLLTDAVRTVTDPLTEIDKYRAGRRRREYRADKERLLRDRAGFEAERERARALREIIRLHDEAGRGGREPAITLRRAQAIFEASDLRERVLPAVGQLALPVAVREAGAVSLQSTNSPPVRLTTDDVPSFEGEYNASRSGSAEYERIAAVALPREAIQDQEHEATAVIGFIGLRYDGSRTGWKVDLNGKVESATIDDERFVQNVASGEQQIMPRSRFEVRYRRRSVRSITITNVIKPVDESNTR